MDLSKLEAVYRDDLQHESMSIFNTSGNLSRQAMSHIVKRSTFYL